MAGRPQEPMAGVVINGVLHQVPASEVELQQEIEKGVKLQQEIRTLEELRDNRGRELVTLIAAYEEEIRKAREQLELERGPVQSQIEAKMAALEAVKGRLFQLIKPRMGDQKSMKFAGLAGAVVAQRTQKATVPDHVLPALRRLLGPTFGEMFEVTEKAKPRPAFWTVIRQLTSKKTEQLRQLINIDDEGGSVRFVE